MTVVAEYQSATNLKLESINASDYDSTTAAVRKCGTY